MVAGSPPLTRGKVSQKIQIPRAFGITPAHAGKRSCAKKSSRCTRDHPRSRGEKRDLTGGAIMPRGSPPLTRGKGLRRHAGVPAGGITPAHAGKSEPGLLRHHLAEDHPRSRGEKLSVVGLMQMSWGSPPLTRGKGYDFPHFPCLPRITPAHAGKSIIINVKFTHFRDHPRSRGEKALRADLVYTNLGSPPLTRGKVLRVAAGHLPRGITPAHAGKRIRGRCKTGRF